MLCLVFACWATALYDPTSPLWSHQSKGERCLLDGSNVHILLKEKKLSFGNPSKPYFSNLFLIVLSWRSGCTFHRTVWHNFFPKSFQCYGNTVSKKGYGLIICGIVWLVEKSQKPPSTFIHILLWPGALPWGAERIWHCDTHRHRLKRKGSAGGRA